MSIIWIYVIQKDIDEDYRNRIFKVYQGLLDD